MSPRGLKALAAAARAFAEIAEEIAAETTAGDPTMLPEAEAATHAGVSVRVLRDARRAGELTFYGKQRSRTCRREDLDAWIERRRAPARSRAPAAPAAANGVGLELELDIDRRIAAAAAGQRSRRRTRAAG